MRYLFICLFFIGILVTVSCMPEKTPETVDGKITVTESDKDLVIKIKTKLKPDLYEFGELKIGYGIHDIDIYGYYEVKQKTDNEFIFLTLPKPKRGIKNATFSVFVRIKATGIPEIYSKSDPYIPAK
jgi:hypothetical protein